MLKSGTRALGLLVGVFVWVTCLEFTAVAFAAAAPAQDHYIADEDVVLVVDAPGVLANDSLGEGSLAVSRVLSPPIHGVLVLGLDGSFLYSAEPDWFGTDYFLYEVSVDGETSLPAEVMLEVVGVNDPPEFSAGTDVSVFEDSPGYSGTWATSISPGPYEEEPVEFSVECSNTSLFSTQPTIDPSGTLRFTVAPDVFGSTTATATLSDSMGDTRQHVFTIAIQGVNDRPKTLSTTLQYQFYEDNVLSVAAPGVLGNHSDPDGDVLTASVVRPPDWGSLDLNDNGSFLFTPPADYFGGVTFSYSVMDGSLSTTEVVVSLIVWGVNDPPTLVGGADVVVDEDSGPYARSWTTSITGGPYEGAASIAVSCDDCSIFSVQPAMSAEGVLTFTPAPDAWGSTRVAVTARDYQGLSREATFAITIAEVHDDAPVAVPDTTLSSLVPTSAGDTGQLGISVAISGDTAVVGQSALGQYDPARPVLVFTRSGLTWTQQAELTVSDAGNQFGREVAISDDTIVVGSPVRYGGAYVFVRDGTSWELQATLKPSIQQSDDYFAGAVAISGDTIAVGAQLRDTLGVGLDSGSVFVFRRVGAHWFQDAEIRRTGYVGDDSFGAEVALSGETLLATAPRDDVLNENSGAAYVWVSDGTTWTPQARLDGNGGWNEGNSWSVALCGDTAAIGLQNSSNFGDHSGQVLVFERSGGGWSRETTIAPSQVGVGDAFGSAVAISDGTLLVGADGDDASGADAGAAYVWSRTDRVWEERAKIVPPSTATTSAIGSAVAISGENIVLGANLNGTRGLNAGCAYGGLLLAEDSVLSVSAPGVLSNDADPDEDFITAHLVSDVSNGTLAFSTDGSFLYAPKPGWFGRDTFAYYASDGERISAPTQVTIDVMNVNDPPCFSGDSSVVVSQDSGAHDAAWATSISPGPYESESFTFSVSGYDTSLFFDPPVIDTSGRISFRPAQGKFGLTAAVVRLTDAWGASCESTITIRIEEDTTTPVLGWDARAFYDDTAIISINASDSGSGVVGAGYRLDDEETHTAETCGTRVSTDVLGDHVLRAWAWDAAGNVSEAMETTFFVRDRTGPQVLCQTPDCYEDVATVAVSAVDTGTGLASIKWSLDGGGTVSASTDATEIVVAEPGMHEIIVWAEDRSGNESRALSLDFEVEDTPRALADRFVLHEDEAFACTSSVLANDSDGDVLEAELVQDVGHGVLCLDPDGSFVYEPSPDWYGEDSFTYRASDGVLKSVPTKVALSVEPRVDACGLVAVSRDIVLPTYGARATISGRLASGSIPLAGRTIWLQHSLSPTGFFAETGLAGQTDDEGRVSVSIRPSWRRYYRFRFAGESDHYVPALSRTTSVIPRPSVGTPCAPASALTMRAYDVSGILKPAHPLGGRPVRIYKWRYHNGAWKAYGYVSATTVAVDGFSSKYAARIALPYPGTWRLRAYAPADAWHAAAWSLGSDAVVVR